MTTQDILRYAELISADFKKNKNQEKTRRRADGFERFLEKSGSLFVALIEPQIDYIHEQDWTTQMMDLKGVEVTLMYHNVSFDRSLKEFVVRIRHEGVKWAIPFSWLVPLIFENQFEDM